MLISALTKVSVLLFAALLLTPDAAKASEPVWATNNDSQNRTSSAFWDYSRFSNARPVPLMKASKAGQPIQNNALPLQSSSGMAGQGPSVTIKQDFQPFLSPSAPANPTTDNVPNSAGSRGAYFSSSRVVPNASDVTYPFAAVGKLFFSDNNGRAFICSASVIRPRVVATAGHCVHSANRGSFYRNFVFVPGYRNGAAPLGRWSNWSTVYTTSEWANGTGAVPNAADFALIVFNDQNVGGQVQKIGSVTGWLGYRTGRLVPNHATLLGYPGNLDNGQVMHRVDAQSFATNSPNSAEYGSDMGGGSSGGPWVQDFGILATGQSVADSFGPNLLVGITSYGPRVAGPHYQGSSILNQSFLNLVNAACGQRAGNC